MFLSKFFFKIRLRAIQNSSIVLSSNPFSGQFSLSQIEQARKNRKINQKWFIRNYYQLKSKLTNEDFMQLAENLGFGFSNLMEIERALENSGN
jgi:hypothetical protein